MATVTKRAATELARRARRHGYFSRDALSGYVFCPQCREEVTGIRTINAKTGRYTTMAAALDAAMVDHLTTYCGED